MYHILVVDDENRIRALIRKYAEFEGHTVTEAGDGMEAVVLCRKQTFDLIIMDIMMPELDGFSACREIRKITPTPIIILSQRDTVVDNAPVKRAFPNAHYLLAANPRSSHALTNAVDWQENLTAILEMPYEVSHSI
jgi:CheY-like chemotaxis protein